MTTTDLNLNGVDLSTAVPEAIVVDVVRPLVGRRRHKSVEVAGRPGSWRFDEEPGDRTIKVVLDIQAASFADRRAAVRALAQWADIGTTTALIIDDEPDRYHEALLDSDDDVLERLCYGEAEIEFLVGPYALKNVLSSVNATATTNPDSDTFNAPDDINSDPIVQLTAVGGTITGLTWTLNDDTISWSGVAIAAGASITISSVSDTVTRGVNADVNLTGAYDPADVDMQDVSGVFGLILPGANDWSLSWTGTATSITIVILWRERTR